MEGILHEMGIGKYDPKICHILVDITQSNLDSWCRGVPYDSK